jgi:dTDP-4-amino-4,6-dideoxygalactose transaminase
MISVFGGRFDDDEIKEVSDCIRSHWIGMGKRVEQFEQEFSATQGLSNFLMVDSGSNALYLAIKLLNLPPGSEIILPSFTWVSCAQAVLLNNCTPIFCDVDINTCNTTAEHIQKHITPKTAAIMVVHYAGLPVDMQPILSLGYPVIEDAAHAVDSFIGDKLCGSLGKVGIYSFDAVKNIAVGEGGGITFTDDTLLQQAKKLRYCGIEKSGFQNAQNKNTGRWWEYNISEPFIKMLPTDLSAAMGIAQLKKFKANQQRRKQIWDYYHTAFKNREEIQIPIDAVNHNTHSYFTYLIQAPKRDELAKYLYDKGIYTTLRYHPLHLNAIYNCHYKLANSEILNEKALNIPLHPNLSDTDVEYVANSIIVFFKTNK